MLSFLGRLALLSRSRHQVARECDGNAWASAGVAFSRFVLFLSPSRGSVRTGDELVGE